MNLEESTFIRHEPCPNCSSSDAFSIYSDGHGYCFSCNHRTPPDGSNQTPSKGVGFFEYGGDFTALKSRRITEETCRKFNVRIETSKRVLRFPYTATSNKVNSYKEKTEDKDFYWKGKNTDQRLFGQNLFGGGKTLVITEGELDSLACWEARKNWPVMSVANGSKGAYKNLSAQLPHLLKFEEIILMFDTDEAGKAAAEECASLFPADQIFIADLGQYKDASEAVMAGDAEAIRQAIWNKKSYSPKAIIDGRSLFDLVNKPLHGKDADWPYPSLNKVTGGLRLGELVTWTAGSGAGKSTAIGETCQSLVDQGFTVCYIALEESVQRQALRLMTVKANKPLHLNNEIPEDELRKAFDASVGSGKVYLRDGFGSVDPDHLLNDIRFVVKNHNAQFVIIDHLSILLSGNENDNERIMIDKIMTRLRSFVEEVGCGMILISHLRRTQSDKGHEEGAAISLSQLRGSHSIATLSDICVGLQRNISAGDNMSELIVMKNRFNGSTGSAGILNYSKDTGRLIEITKPTESSPDSYGDF